MRSSDAKGAESRPQQFRLTIRLRLSRAAFRQRSRRLAVQRATGSTYAGRQHKWRDSAGAESEHQEHRNDYSQHDGPQHQEFSRPDVRHGSEAIRRPSRVVAQKPAPAYRRWAVLAAAAAWIPLRPSRATFGLREAPGSAEESAFARHCSLASRKRVNRTRHPAAAHRSGHTRTGRPLPGPVRWSRSALIAGGSPWRPGRDRTGAGSRCTARPSR